MKQIILGTAGHIDHGKTSLIKAVTGTNTDRLKEEQKRGITIELGFASLDLPSGRHLGIVDVPGHEKFVKNMVAGATGIDIVTMVIAADEGVMPQTREHMEICTLLGIKYGLVVLTKIDMVDEEWLELVTEDIRDFTRGTFLEEAPIVPVSSMSGQGIPRFIETLDTLSENVPERASSGLFRLPVDRVFSMKGFGTVITGTLISGKINVGETIMIYPSKITSKVRGLQVHNQGREMAEAGMRTAINFQGLEKAAINRGEIIARENTLTPSYMVDLELLYLSSNRKPMKNRTQVRFHTGTSETMGNLILLDREDLLPGDTCPAQIRLDEPVSLIRDDRFVIRSYSPVRTIGGGKVLNPIPAKHKRFQQAIIDGLMDLVESDAKAIIDYQARMAGPAGVTFADLLLMTNQPEKALTTTIANLLNSQTIVLVDKDNRTYVHLAVFDQLKTLSHDVLEQYHQRNPLKPGISKEELKSKFPRKANAKLFTQVLNRMIKDQQLVLEDDTVRLATHTVSLQVDQEVVKQQIADIYRQSGLTPPYFREITADLEMDAKSARGVLELLIGEGVLIKVKEDLYYDSRVIEKLKEKLVAHILEKGEISTPEFKDMTGASRKYVIPLIEHFDATNVTIRVGDIRKLRKRQ
ncbi:selenocysteine-specific translation factor [Desulfosarcina ovata subsp. sediminis]|uniref:Selenocysteine-specific elongation factor n=1 Tax=Desulfosarcina ovata subsp. sediminis TaxID=885957 RepID=A0A5K7ZGI5_9BACT|nr:selenocysteine-specific translation elongation factor [Desulfosarcina ovata]BBO81202.1 selenocysteine-specific translation factor [Desulfosarcina ovata subsp. sediminis]